MAVICIICNDDIDQEAYLCVLKCGHTFHQDCVTEWLNRTKTCPQCRSATTKKSMSRVYLNMSNDESLQSRLDDASLQLDASKATCTDYEEKLKNLEIELEAKRITINSLDCNLEEKQNTIDNLRSVIRTQGYTILGSLALKDGSINLLSNINADLAQERDNFRESYENTLINKDSEIAALKNQMVHQEQDSRQQIWNRAIYNENRVRFEQEHASRKMLELSQRLNSAQEEIFNLKNKYEPANSKRTVSDEVIDLTESPKRLRTMSDASDRFDTSLNDNGSSVVDDEQENVVIFFRREAEEWRREQAALHRGSDASFRDSEVSDADAIDRTHGSESEESEEETATASSSSDNVWVDEPLEPTSLSFLGDPGIRIPNAAQMCSLNYFKPSEYAILNAAEHNAQIEWKLPAPSTE